MFAGKISALVLVAVVAQLALADHQDYIYDQEHIMGRMDFERLLQIKQDVKNKVEKCNTYNSELREMLGPYARDTISAHGLFQRIANVISNRHPFGAGLEVEAELEECAEVLAQGGYKGQSVQDASFAPSKSAHPVVAGGVDEGVVIGRLDFDGLLATEEESRSKGAEERCSVLEEELREQLGDLAVGLAQDDLFNRVVCVLDRRSGHFQSSLKVWDHLTSCLGAREHLPDLSETCWPHA